MLEALPLLRSYIKFDTYSLVARILPVYLSLTPILLLLTVIVPEEINFLTARTILLVLVPLSFLIGQVGAYHGQHLEKKLWDDRNEFPTTRFLRYGNNEFNEFTRSRIHTKLRKLGLYVPTYEEQKKDSKTADKHYRSCTEDLIRRTRDVKKFPLVHRGLTEYGFHRNLLGLRYFGIFSAIAGIVGSITWGWVTWDETNTLQMILLAAGFMSIGLLLIWKFWIIEDMIKVSAERYARFILESALNQE